MKLLFYPYDFEYRVEEDGVYVYMYSRTKEGKKVVVRILHDAFFYASVEGIDTKDLAKRLEGLEIDAKGQPASFVRYEEVTREFLGKKKTFWKIFVNYPKAVPIIAAQLEEWGVTCYERDILFVHRFLRDVTILPMTLVEADGEFEENSHFRVELFTATHIMQKDANATYPWKMLAVDIETYAVKKEIDPERNPILMVAFYGVDSSGDVFEKVITWKNFDHSLDYAEHVADEKALLERIKEVLVEYDPDIVTGYFSDGFDFPYIDARATKLSVTLDVGIDKSYLIVHENRGFRSSEAKIRGIVHVDLLPFVRYIFGLSLKTDSYSLDSVAGELLGHTKHDVNLDELAGAWDEGSEKLSEFVEYNLHDARLTWKLCAKLLPDMLEFSKIVGLPLFDIIRMRFSRLVEGYILKRGIEFGVVAPNKPKGEEIGQRRDDRYEGGFVFEPTPGLYTDLVVFDFRSLYPTVITAHNIGPESLNCECCRAKDHVPGFDEYWFCSSQKHFLPRILEDLILRRFEVKDQLNDAKAKGEETSMLSARTYALKILANSFYGYLGFFGARWYSFECARATTAYARNYIKQTMEKARENGLNVVYGDTDSLFVVLNGKSKEDAFAFMKQINADLPGYMELEFEGYFPAGIFVSLKGKEGGAKKKYALRREDNTVKIAGFETVRRNWSYLAKEVQQHVLGLVLNGKKDDAKNFVKETIVQLKEGNVSLDKLIMRTQLTRKLEDYSSEGPHVTVARKMREKGYLVPPGTVIGYVIGKGSGLVRERAQLLEDLKDGEYDASYYINNQILPAVSSIFAVLGVSEDELLGKAKQMGLGDF